MSRVNRSLMSSDEPRLSGIDIEMEEEVEITVGNVHYLLVAGEQNVPQHKVRDRLANTARTSLQTPASRATIHRYCLCT